MATRTLESRLERLTVTDENEASEGSNTKLYTKSKVSDLFRTSLTTGKNLEKRLKKKEERQIR